MKSKVGDDSFFKLMDSYDLVLLLETFISKQDEEFIYNRFSNFNLISLVLQKEKERKKSTFGKAIGGKAILNFLYKFKIIPY